MPINEQPVSQLGSVDWEDVQKVIRTFREALGRGELPRLETFLSERSPNRTGALVELVHEKMDFQIKAGIPFQLQSYFERFPELAADSRAVAELVASECALRKRLASQGGGSSHGIPSEIAGPPPPHRQIDRYELGEVIGRGAFGVVFRARDTVLNRAVALKRPRPGVLDAPGAVERFFREAKNAAGLRHPHIVALFDCGEWDGEPYLVSALVDGRNLAEELKELRPGIRRAVEWVVALANALEHAHRSGVIHRDVKPSNVLIDREGHISLTDFGLARSDRGGITLTVDGQVIGTPAYMAPEQVRGEKALVDGRCDVYSLGAILYELLTGSRPFDGPDQMVLVRVLEEDPKPPRRHNAAIPADLETVCMKAMAKERGSRYKSAAEFAADLGRFLRGEPVLARPEGRIRMMARKCRRRPVLVALAASLVAAVCSGLAGITWQWRESESHRLANEANLAQSEEQRESAVRTLTLGVNALSRLAGLPDADVARVAGGSGEPVMTRVDRPRGLATSRRNDTGFLPELAQASRNVARVLDDASPAEVSRAAWFESLKLFKELVRLHPTTVDFRMGLGECHYRLSLHPRGAGRSPEDDEHRRLGQAVWQELFADLKRQLNETPAASSLKRQFCLCALSLGDLANVSGQRAEAVAGLRDALKIVGGVSDDPRTDLDRRKLLGAVLSELATLLQIDRPEEAMTLAHSAVNELEAVLRSDPDAMYDSFRLVRAIDCLAVVEDRRKRPHQALRDFHRAADLYRRLLRNRPFNVSDRRSLATVLHRIGRISHHTGHPGVAIEPYRAAVELREAILVLTPENFHRREEYAGTLYRLGSALESLGQMGEAVEKYTKAIAHQRQVSIAEPGNPGHRARLDEWLRRTSFLLRLLGRNEEAIALARERKSRSPDDLAFSIRAAGRHVGVLLANRGTAKPRSGSGPKSRPY